jgi:predicted phage terminase large subunit-like protein
MVTIIKPQEGPQHAFLATPVDIAFYGGAAGGGKSHALIMDPLRYIRRPGFGAVIFRRTHPQITSEGGLWDTAGTIYPHVGGIPYDSLTEYRFPTKGGGFNTIAFKHMQHEKTRLEYQGAQIPMMGFDELPHFTRGQFTYMLSRARTLCGIKPYIRGTCNPDPDSWVKDWVSWYIDPETGYAIPERSGQIRYLVRDSDTLYWSSSKEDLAKNYPTLRPLSFTFIKASLTDNKILMEKNPEYEANLMALPKVEREQLFGGNWNVRRAPGSYFKREWFGTPLGTLPMKPVKVVRYWDRAATEPSEESPDPDWTAGVKACIFGDGTFCIMHVERFRHSPGKTRERIRATVDLDGPDVEQVFEEDPGASGKTEMWDLLNSLAGYNVHACRVDENKVTRALPFSAMVENGSVRVLKGPWLGAYMDELEAFDIGAHDDQVDGSSGAFNRLTNRGMPRARRA